MKKFFTKVSPKAVDGIRRVYEARGAEVHAKIQSDGSAIVVVTMGQSKSGSKHTYRRKRSASSSRGTDSAHVAA